MAVYLVAVDGPDRWPLREGDGVIGSDPGSWIQLPAEAGVEARHARLEVTPRRITVTPDEGPVRVNAHPVSEATALRPGDKIDVGQVALRLEVHSLPKPAATPSPTPTPAATAAPAAVPTPAVASTPHQLGVALPPPEPPKWRVGLVLLAGVLAIAAVAAVIKLVPQRTAASGPPMLPAVREKVRAATVWIRASLPEGESEGSGYVCAPGYVLTNAHVVNRGENIEVIFDSGTEQYRQARAKLLKSGHPGEVDDVALLSVPTGAIPPLTRADVGALDDGTPVTAFGFPLGSTVSTSENGPQISIRSGTVTALRKDNQGQLAWIESDILAEVGNSGGPVVTNEGRVVGLATMLVGPNLRTARIVPATLLKQFAPQAQ